MSETKTFKLLYADDNDSASYTHFIQHIVDDQKVEVIKMNDIKRNGLYPDLILFTGGEDVSTYLYNEEKGKYTSSNKKRDDAEKYSFDSLPYRIPRLGICRGAQFLTVMNKGKLIQHVENHTQSHQITLSPEYGNQELTITSTHHQMMYPFNLPKKSYKIIAHSTYFRSPIYLNGQNENIEIPHDFVEPEIVFYPKTTSLCIQGHPEYMSKDDTTVAYIKAIIKNNLFTTEKTEF